MTIELTDVNTGETETVYEENMVTDEIELDELSKELPLSYSYTKWNFDPDDDALYLLTPAANSYGSVPRNGSFIVTKIKFGTWRVTQYEMTNTTGEDFNNYYML